jgi:hypothetical protein
MKDPVENARKYISYGLGQEKLNIAHYKGTSRHSD